MKYESINTKMLVAYQARISDLYDYMRVLISLIPLIFAVIYNVLLFYHNPKFNC